MKSLSRLVLSVLFLAWLRAGCSGSVPPAPTLINATSAPEPTQVRPLPTPMPAGQTIEYNGLRVNMIQTEITSGYDTEFGYRREPTQGVNFLWVNIQIENSGSSQQSLPAIEHFSAVYGTKEVKPAYGHRKDHTDYTSLKTVLLPAQKVTAWLRFDIPASAGMKELWFAYLPDSLRVSFEFPVSGYGWADHPEFFWLCGH